MATPNRAALIAKVLKVVRKHYKPVAPPKERTVLEQLLFACLVEDSPNEAAEQRTREPMAPKTFFIKSSLGMNCFSL